MDPAIDARQNKLARKANPNLINGRLNEAAYWLASLGGTIQSRLSRRQAIRSYAQYEEAVRIVSPEKIEEMDPYMTEKSAGVFYSSINGAIRMKKVLNS